MTIFEFLAHDRGLKSAQSHLVYGVKKVFLVVSIHFQLTLKGTQNLKKIGEMVLAHHGKMVFT